MVISYKHIRINNIYSTINIWSNHTQYYRTLLRAHSICMPSTVPYTLMYKNNSNRMEFKSRQLANIIGKFVYNYIKLIKTYSYFYQLFKRTIDTKSLKRIRNHKIYKGKQLIFTLKLKHFILLIRDKIQKKVRSNRHKMWQFFYSIPNNFWNYSAKKRIRLIIWLIFSSSNKKVPERYLEKNERVSGDLYFLNYNRISHLIYTAFKRKRLPKKEWMLLKNNSSRKRKKRKFGVYFYNNLLEETFTSISNNKLYNNMYNGTNKVNISKLDININYYLIHNYFFLLFYIKLNNIDYHFLSLYYLYLSSIYLKRINNKLNLIYSYNTQTFSTSRNSNNNSVFKKDIWYNIFVREHNTYSYFNINGIICFKNILNKITYHTMSTKLYRKNIFFIQKNILANNNVIIFESTNCGNKSIININNFFYKKNYYRKSNFKNSQFKNFSIKKKKNTYTLVPIIYKKIINKISYIKKNIYYNKLKIIHINSKRNNNNNIDILRTKITKRYMFRRKYYNNFKNYTTSLFYNRKNKYFTVTHNKLNRLFINSYKIKLYNMYNFINKKNKNRYRYLFLCNVKKYHIIKNKSVIYSNSVNNIYNYKVKRTNNIGSNNNTINIISYDIKIMYKNSLLYLLYFNNNIIYKNIINEYNIRVHNKNNKYEHLFILNRNIIIFTNKQKNVGTIKNGIHLYTNVVYINNNINNIFLLNTINTYMNMLYLSPINKYIYKKYRQITD